MVTELGDGAFLSTSLQVLFDRSASQEVVDFLNRNKLNDDGLPYVRKVEDDLLFNDAEEKQNQEYFRREQWPR